jgi:hypothetical protein
VSDRTLAAAIESMLSDREVPAALAAFLDWPGGAVRALTGVGPKSWDSQTWTGVGTLGSIDKIAEGLQKSDFGVQLTLNYLDDTLRNQIIANDPIGAAASLYLWQMNLTTGLVSEGAEIFTGFIDEVEIEDNGSDGRIMVRLAHETARLGQSTFYLLNDAHQQHLFPGDRGMEFAPRMDEPVLWGRKPTVVDTQRTPRLLPPSSDPSNPSGPPAPNPRLPENQPGTAPTVPRTHPALRP